MAPTSVAYLELRTAVTSLTTAIGANVTDRPKAQVVEVDAAGRIWIKCSTSGGQEQGCIELAGSDAGVHVRCSRDRSGGQLALPTVANLIAWIRLRS